MTTSTLTAFPPHFSPGKGGDGGPALDSGRARLSWGMDACRRPEIEYPFRCPLKVIGKRDLLRPEAVAALLEAHLGPQPEGDRAWTEHPRGAYVSYTFWATLPNDQVEVPLRQAIQALPGVVLQL